jgi:hypothetical protein
MAVTRAQMRELQDEHVARVSLLAGCSAAWLAMELMSRWYERRRAGVVIGTGGSRPRSSGRRSR